MSTDQEDMFVGHVALTARQRSCVLGLLMDAYVGGSEVPLGTKNRREFYARLTEDLIGPLRLVVAADPASPTSPTSPTSKAAGQELSPVDTVDMEIDMSTSTNVSTSTSKNTDKSTSTSKSELDARRLEEIARVAADLGDVTVEAMCDDVAAGDTDMIVLRCAVASDPRYWPDGSLARLLEDVEDVDDASEPSEETP